MIKIKKKIKKKEYKAMTDSEVYEGPEGEEA